MTLSNNENIQVLIQQVFFITKTVPLFLLIRTLWSSTRLMLHFCLAGLSAFRRRVRTFSIFNFDKKGTCIHSSKTYLLLDYSKWGINSLCNSFPLEQIDIIITDNKAPKDSVSKIVKLGKEIIIVNPETKSIENHYNPPILTDLKSYINYLTRVFHPGILF